MNKNVLFIENDFNDFEYFSNILIDAGFNVYPQNIESADALLNFLHGHSCNYNILKENVFNYIIEKEFYTNNKLLLILDINLFKKNENNKFDECGITLLRDFRNDFYTYFKSKKGEDERYKNWSLGIYIIALTNFDDDKCRKFVRKYGSFFHALNKDDVKGDTDYLLNKLETMEYYIKNRETEQSNNYIIINNGDYIGSIGGDYVKGEQIKTTGEHSPITNQSYNNNEIELIKELTNKYKVTQKDADDLVQILKDEEQSNNKENLNEKMKIWWEKVKNYTINFGLSVFSNLLVSSCLLPPEQVTIIIEMLAKID